MWLAVLLTVLASTGNNVGKVFQKKGTRGLPRLSLDKKILLLYFNNRVWLFGFSIDLIGALLMIAAVAMAPVSIVQPISGTGLAVMAVFSHYYLRERMRKRDWWGVALACLGTILMGMSGEEKNPRTPPQLNPRRLFLFVASLFASLSLLSHYSKRMRRRRRQRSKEKEEEGIEEKDEREEREGEKGGGGGGGGDQAQRMGEALEEIVLGAQAGACFGLSAAAVKTGFLLSLSSSPPLRHLFPPLGVLSGVCLSSTGFYFQTRGFKDGRVMVVSTCAAVFSLLSGVLAGVVGLGEALPREEGKGRLRMTSWSLILLGIILLLLKPSKGAFSSSLPTPSSSSSSSFLPLFTTTPAPMPPQPPPPLSSSVSSHLSHHHSPSRHSFSAALKVNVE